MVRGGGWERVTLELITKLRDHELTGLCRESRGVWSACGEEIPLGV